MIALKEKERKEPRELIDHSGCGRTHVYANPDWVEMHVYINPDWVEWAKKEIEILRDEPEEIDETIACDILPGCQNSWSWATWARQEIERLRSVAKTICHVSVECSYGSEKSNYLDRVTCLKCLRYLAGRI